jgi:hypothetical protein
MCIKVLGHAKPTKKNMVPYSADDIDYFWSRVNAQIEFLPTEIHQAIRSRQPSRELQRAVTSAAGRAGVFTLTGRLRGHANYTARHNTIFQGLAADGAKLGLWKLWRAGFRIVNFIHDQVLIEVAANADLQANAETIRELMIAGMKEVIPNIRIDVKYAAMDRWYAGAEAVIDETTGQLLLWTPNEKATSSSAMVATESIRVAG